MTYEQAIQKAQKFERSAMMFMDKAARDASRFGDSMEYMAEQCAADMMHWYQIARQLSRGENVHLWDMEI